MDATRPDADRPDADRPDADRPSEQDVASRADLLPEEQEAGSADPQAQAQAILEDSLDRTDDPEGTREESTQTPD